MGFTVLLLSVSVLVLFVIVPGILEAEDNYKPEDDPGDEVLAELKKKQQELKVLSQHNLMITKRLYKLAKEEMQRQELRKKMAAADADVSTALTPLEAWRVSMDIYNMYLVRSCLLLKFIMIGLMGFN